MELELIFTLKSNGINLSFENDQQGQLRSLLKICFSIKAMIEYEVNDKFQKQYLASYLKGSKKRCYIRLLAF